MKQEPMDSFDKPCLLVFPKRECVAGMFGRDEG